MQKVVPAPVCQETFPLFPLFSLFFKIDFFDARGENSKTTFLRECDFLKNGVATESKHCNAGNRS